MSDLGQRLAQPSGVLALIRAAAIPVFFAAERIVDHPEANGQPFVPLLALAALYALLALTGELYGRPLGSGPALAVIDLILIAALVATSGGPFSQLRYAFFMLPIGAALQLRPRLTAAASVTSVTLYALIAVTYPGTVVRADAIGFEFTQGLFLAWMGAAATMLSALLARRADELAALAAGRGRLVAQALDAEGLARRRLAEALHDDALQNLLAARQVLGPHTGGDLALVAQGLDEGVRQVREAVFDLHPYLLEQAGLQAALHAVAARAAEQAGFKAAVEVQPAAEGVHDQLIFSIARELIVNAAKHAEAGTVDVIVTRDDDAVELLVVDDGHGTDAAQVRQAPLRGHIGLASCAERARVIGGTFDIARADAGRGTRIRVRLPAPVWTGVNRSSNGRDSDRAGTTGVRGIGGAP